MVAVAQWLEHQAVALGVAGSNPVSHPTHDTIVILTKFKKIL